MKTILPARSPNLNAFAERWARSAKQECRSRLILFGERPLSRTLAEFSAHYHGERNQGKITNCFSRRRLLVIFWGDFNNLFRRSQTSYNVSLNSIRLFEGLESLPSVDYRHLIDLVDPFQDALAEFLLRLNADVFEKGARHLSKEGLDDI